MRAFRKGEFFMGIGSEEYFTDADNKDSELPVFSEGFLYEKVGKDNARFILGVVEEYDAIIRFLGEEAVKAILEKYKRTL